MPTTVPSLWARRGHRTAPSALILIRVPTARIAQEGRECRDVPERRDVMIRRRLMQAMIVHRDHDKGGSQGRPPETRELLRYIVFQVPAISQVGSFVAFGVFASLYDFHSLFDRRFECLF